MNHHANIIDEYIPNQKRIREILEGQIALGAGKKMNMPRQKKSITSPWINFVKDFAEDNGLTYGEALSEAGPYYRASGLSMGGYGTSVGARKGWITRRKNVKKSGSKTPKRKYVKKSLSKPVKKTGSKNTGKKKAGTKKNTKKSKKSSRRVVREY